MKKGMQTGPDLIPIVVPVILALLLAAPALAGIEDGPDAGPVARGVARGASEPVKVLKVRALTEDPGPIDLLAPIPFVPWPAFAPTLNGASLFANPEVPRVIAPRDAEVVIVEDPETEGECNQRQIEKCTAACKQVKKLAYSCDVQFEWQPDGSCTRTLLCTCQSPGASTGNNVAGMRRGEAVELTVADSCALEPVCATGVE